MNIQKVPFFLIKIIYFVNGYFSQLYYRNIAEVHKNAKLLPSAKIFNIKKSCDSIQIDANTLILGELLTFGHGGSIKIGKNCYVGENSRIWSAKDIKIGDRVLISHNVNIHDTDGHPTDSVARHRHFIQITTVGHPRIDLDLPSANILIEDDVWIGFNSTILKGVNIGKGAIIGASSVVTKNVLPYTVVAGNPAKFIRNINKDENIKDYRKSQDNLS